MTVLHHFGLAFMAFFAIMNPLTNLPVYLSLTASDDAALSRAVARRSLLIAFAIVAVFSLCGQYIFEMFGMTLPALRLAGGVLVFLIGFHMLQGRQSPAHHPDDVSQQNWEDKMSVAVSPLATPLLAGPGAIATAMNLSAQDTVWITVSAFALLCVMTYVLFVYGKTVVRLIGNNAMNVITRMMGLILTVIGVQMLISGIHGAFPNL
ncbi:MarC family protein [Neisseria chenwenguii]|nr:MarC family protein [Neisseria chenwenguii]